ncbi:gliding motility-associated C-terminal domain-containing protein [Psychroserpens mesophilus]|uniref:T9SS type B sorting domain-containing protein n=1 Tax=Psychroserpens mesophilus TaxID=325473 RepID=UPI003D6626F9
MKKITFLFALFLAFSTWNINAQITNYPYFEDFESGDGGWTVDDPASGSWELGTPANTIINSADSGVNAWVTNLTGSYGTGEDAAVVSPVFDLSSLSAPSIEFSIWWNAEFSWDGMVLQSSVDGGASWQNVGDLGDPNNWFNDDTIGGNPGGQPIGWTGRNSSNNGSGGWVVARHALVGLAGESNVILRFAFGSDGSVQDEGVAFDSINIFEVSCPEPSGITVTGILAATADVTWTPGGIETNWEIAVQAAGTGAPTESGVATTNNPYTATGLTANTEYEVYVRSDCSGEFSSWVGPFNFITPCGAITPDYNADMSVNVPDACWDEANDGEIADGPSGSGTSDWRDGTDYAFGASNAINLFGNTDREWLLSPFFDLSAGGYQLEVNVAVTNWNGGFTDDTMGSDDEVKLLQSIDGGATWTTLTTWNAANEPAVGGTEYIEDLSAVTGTNVQFAIWASDGAVNDTEDYDFHVGKFRVRTPPTCPEPLNLTIDSFSDVSVDISWTPGDSETSWQVVVQPAGTGEPTGPGAVTTNNPYTATGLTATTDYEVWVRGDCGAGGLSSWTGPVTFTTFNTPPPPPVGVTCVSGSSSFIYTADFDSLDGWTGNINGGDGTWLLPGTSISGATGPNAAFSGANYMHYEASGPSSDTASAVSPAIDLSTAVDGAELSFYMHAFGAGMGTLNVGVSTSPTGPFSNEFAWAGDLQTSGDDPWVPIGINLDAYLGQVIYVEFSHTGIGDFEGDMAIDLVRVETCGSFCIAPSSIVVSNVGGTNADITWNANNGETSWEYVVVPAGTGEPSGSGTPVGATTVNETGLDFSTDYEVWVRADCGGGTFSIWAGPINFTTTIQTVFNIDCTQGPTQINYCYQNNDTTNWTFTSSDGSPIRITFSSGTIEAGFDELTIYDGTDNTGNVLFNSDTDGVFDFAGLTFDSIVGDSIFMEVDSDGSVSCESEARLEWDFTVSCATCVNPIATYQVIDDCASGNQFLIDVNITSLGDATSLTISNNIDATTVPVTAPGVYQIGPFPFLVDVIVTTSHDQDTQCVINSSPIQLLACPPDNDNPCNATVAVVNADESCNLTTPGTLVEATPSGVPNGSCTGNPDDDVWFEFVALGEQQIISITNINGGTTNIDHALYEGDCNNNLTELYCTGDDNALTPSLVVGNTYYVRVFSGGNASETSTFDLCINTLGPPTFCLDALPICASDLEYPSIIGDEIAPPYLDYDCLGSQPDPIWNSIYFDEAGDYVFTLEQTGLDGTGNDVDFIVWGPFNDQPEGCYNLLPENVADCSFSFVSVETITLNGVQAGDVYLILITNYSQDDGVYTFTQDSGPTDGTNCEIVCDAEILYQGTEVAEDPMNVGFSAPIELCGIDSIDLEASSPYADSYQWYDADNIPIIGATDPVLTVTESGGYFVEVNGDVCEGFSYSITVLVTLGEEAVANPVADMITCDDASADGFEEFDLQDQTAAILGTQDAADFNVTYHVSPPDAGQGLNPLPLTDYINTSNPQTIYVRVEDADAPGCFALTSFNLDVSGTTPTATSDVYPECDTNQDGIAGFDLPSRDVNILDGQSAADFTVTYYTSQQGADDGIGSMDQIDTSTLYNSPAATIFVRVESILAFDCYATTTMDLVVNLSPDSSFTLTDLVTCDDASDDGVEAFNLEQQTEFVLGTQNPADFNVTYHFSFADAENGVGALSSPYTNTSNPQMIYVRIENATAPVCYVLSSFNLDISGPTPTVNNVVYSECDDDLDGETLFDLASQDGNVLGSQNAANYNVTYHETQADADGDTGAIDSSSLYSSTSTTLFVRIESIVSSGCYSTGMLELEVNPLPDTTFTTSIDYELCPNATAPLIITATANNYNESDVTIRWYFEGGLIPGENSLELSVTEAGLYEIEVVFNQTQCIADLVEQTVIELDTCVIPQGISPNGDMINETFDLSSYNVSKLEIFNRNGTLVYSKKNYTNEWYGQSNDGDELPVGTYFYTMEYDNGKQRTAWVYIQREN